MASIRKRKTKDGKTRYRALIRIKGFQPQCATFSTLTAARQWVKCTEAAMMEGRHFKTGEARKRTLAELIDRYLQSRECDSITTFRLNWWKKQLGYKILADVEPCHVAEMRDKLLASTTNRGTPFSPSTVVRYMAAMSHAFSIAVKEWGWLDDSPMRKVSRPREPSGRVRFLSDDERERLLEACRNSYNPYLYPIVVLALSTGMRQGEIMNLTWADVDFERQCITLHKTKNRERRSVPLVGLSKELLLKHAKVRQLNSLLLFPGKNLKKPMEMRKAWLRAFREARLKDFTTNDLRHSCASYLAMRGASTLEIAEILGHKTLAMVKRYTHYSDKHTHQLVLKLDKIFTEPFDEQKIEND